MNLEHPTTRYSVTSGTKGAFKAKTLWYHHLNDAEDCAHQTITDGGWAVVHDWHTDTHYLPKVTV